MNLQGLAQARVLYQIAGETTESCQGSEGARTEEVQGLGYLDPESKKGDNRKHGFGGSTCFTLA